MSCPFLHKPWRPILSITVLFNSFSIEKQHSFCLNSSCWFCCTAQLLMLLCGTHMNLRSGWKCFSPQTQLCWLILPDLNIFQFKLQEVDYKSWWDAKSCTVNWGTKLKRAWKRIRSCIFVPCLWMPQFGWTWLPGHKTLHSRKSPHPTLHGRR